jgi:hypothetical protein
LHQSWILTGVVVVVVVVVVAAAVGEKIIEKESDGTVI